MKDSVQRLNPAGAIPPSLREIPPPPPPSSGRQPTTGGPYHAVIRGPNGLDISISGSAEIVAAQLRAVAATLHPVEVKINYRDGGR